MGQPSQDSLEEGINSPNAEVTIVVQNLVQRFSTSPADFRLCS